MLNIGNAVMSWILPSMMFQNDRGNKSYRWFDGPNVYNNFKFQITIIELCIE